MAGKKKKKAGAEESDQGTEVPKSKKQQKGSFSIFIAKKVPPIAAHDDILADEPHPLSAGTTVLLEIAKGLTDMKDANAWLKKNGASLNKQRIIIAHVKADSVVKTETEVKITFG